MITKRFIVGFFIIILIGGIFTLFKSCPGVQGKTSNVDNEIQYGYLTKEYILCIQNNMETADKSLLEEMESETDFIISYLHQVFNGDVPLDETSDSALNRYNVNNDTRVRYVERIEYDLKRMGVWLDGNNGLLWINYTRRWFDKQGNLLYGAGSIDDGIDAVLLLEKKNDEWVVVEIIEDP